MTGDCQGRGFSRRAEQIRSNMHEDRLDPASLRSTLVDGGRRYDLPAQVRPRPGATAGKRGRRGTHLRAHSRLLVHLRRRPEPEVQRR